MATLLAAVVKYFAIWSTLAAIALAAPRRLLGSSFGAPAFDIYDPSHNATFDYVVLGGGTAGIPVAVRLAEAGYTVALVEGGSFYEIGNSNFSQIPVYCPAFSGPDPTWVSPQVDWNLTTVPQTGEDDQVKLYPRGKTLGGSSARNYLAYHFGTNGSYQQWADAVGDDSYKMENFAHYLHKGVNFTKPSESRAANATTYFSENLLQDTQGPLQVTFGAYAWAFSTWARKALEQVGMADRLDGFTNGGLFGNSYVLQSEDGTTYTRDSSETSYLQKLGLNNSNLIVYPSTLGKRVLFDSNKTAIGAEVDFAGVPLTLYARKEVIVSGGVFQSPQLLMVSGIGPKSTLDQYNIPVLFDLAGVGQNLWDHVIGGISYRVNVVTISHLQADPAFQQNALQEYLADTVSGPYTTFGSDLFAFEKLPSQYRQKLSNTTQVALQQFADDWPNLEFLVDSRYVGTQPGFTGSPDGLDYGSITVALVSPLSRGNVTIQSADTADKPIINPNWLGDVRDQEVAIQAWRRLQEIFNTSSIQPVLIGPEAYPGLANTTTDAQILAHIKANFGTVMHGSCTCKMGQSNDTMAVLDSRARVYGVQGLRVVDASAFPLLPPGHPQATIYGLAEKIADDIISSA
ncbi:hypothetical protein MMC10_006921 [Thelotrema lepadinum]|nr:hypothetical protein [Thelotrema lepadinum]